MDATGVAEKVEKTPAKRRRVWLPTSWGVISLLLAGLSLSLIHTDWLWRWDQLLYDSQLKFWSRPAPDDIVIVAIDTPSLSQIGRWPWSRQVHAQLVQRLTEAGAKAIVLDILFAEAEQQSPDADRSLIEAVTASGRVVLPVVFEQSGPGRIAGGNPADAGALPGRRGTGPCSHRPGPGRHCPQGSSPGRTGQPTLAEPGPGGSAHARLRRMESVYRVCVTRT